MRIKKQAGAILGNEKGMVLIVVIMLLAALIIIGATAAMQTSTDLKISGNYKTGEQAFYAAEAGIEEARARLRKDAANPINDEPPADDKWKAFIGTDVKSQGKGWDNGNPKHWKYDSLPSDIDYVVEIKHQTDPAGGSGSVLYWGDSDLDGVPERHTTAGAGKNIYLVTSYGSSGSSCKIVETEMARLPPLTVPAALYVEAPTTIQGSSTNIIGTDSCGSDNKPGIVTTKPSTESITTAGNPTITGINSPTGTPDDISDSGTDMDIQSVIDSFKGDADFAYTVNSDTHTGTAVPGPGDDWGTPTPGATLQDPSFCACNNIVYYDTQGTDIKLSGGVTGCGMLLVEGDLDISGGFSWYGPVIVTGAVTFTGGGNKNLTGALLAGGSVDADIIGGNTNIVYCGSAINVQTENRPLRILSWKEGM